MSMARIVLFIGLLAFSAANETIDSLKKLEIKLDSVTEALTQKISVLEKENLELKEKVNNVNTYLRQPTTISNQIHTGGASGMAC